MKEEIWKDIEGYEGIYQISSLGRVKSLERPVRYKFNLKKIIKERILTHGITKSKYHIVVLSIKGKTKTYHVHKLVAKGFLNHTPCGHKLVVDHIDNDKNNNNLNNLQLISQRKNSSKDKNNYTSKYIGVHFCKTNKKYISTININGKSNNLGRFENEYDANLAYQKALSELTDHP